MIPSASSSRKRGSDSRFRGNDVIKILSPAKLNLFLHVLHKRSDGFHELDTLFERIDLCDRLTFKKIPSRIRIKTTSQAIPRGPKNIVWRAADLMRQEARDKRQKVGVEITIKKNIPVAAGLGGGSSNAASTLLALNKLWKLHLPSQRLLELGAKLGSDVPFFILDTPFARGGGRGEILKPLKIPAKKIWHCLVKPPFGISTKEAYEDFSRGVVNRAPTRLTPQKANAKMLIHSIQKGHSALTSKLLFNSLELTLTKRLTAISKIKNQHLRLGALGSLMSGSGSSVFGIYRSKREAQVAARFFRKADKRYKVFVVSTF